MKIIADPRYSEASAPPQVSRAILQYASEQGIAPVSLCRGLGFEPDDLKRPDYRLSHRQNYLLVRRALASLGDDGLGLIVGCRQTAVSWGMVGLAMQASPTLGAALRLAVRYQRHAGALLSYQMEVVGDRGRAYAVPRFFDPQVIAFYLEEAFSSTLATVRHLGGHALQIRHIALEYPAPAHWRRYEQVFRCPVTFAAGHNLIEFDADWLTLPLHTRDDYVAAEIAELLDSARWENQGISDLIETLQREVRHNLGDPPSLSELANLLNLGERTLRRRIAAAGLSYQSIIDMQRRDKALSLLRHSEKSLSEVASETGFSDIRNFRRAFKRWTGEGPREARREMERARSYKESLI